MDPLGPHRDVVHQRGEGLHQPLTIIWISLSLEKGVDQLVVSVLKQADQDVECGRAVRDQLAVDVLREDEVEEELKEGSQRLINRGGLKLVPDHVASEHLTLHKLYDFRISIDGHTHLNEITAESINCVYSNVGKSELKTGHKVLLQGRVEGGYLRFEIN